MVQKKLDNAADSTLNKKEKPRIIEAIKKAEPQAEQAKNVEKKDGLNDVQNEAQKMEVVEKITESKNVLPMAEAKKAEAITERNAIKTSKKMAQEKQIKMPPQPNMVKKSSEPVQASEKQKVEDTVTTQKVKKTKEKTDNKDRLLSDVKIKTGEKVDVVISNKSFRDFKNNTVVRELSTSEKREQRGLGLKLPPHAKQPTRKVKSSPDAAKTWAALKDSTVIDTLDGWSRRADVTLVWNTTADYFLDRNLEFKGDYADAVVGLLQSFEDIPFRPVGQLYKDPEQGFDVLVIQSAE